MLVEMNSQDVIALVNFTHRQAWHLKDLAFLPRSHEKFVSCGVDETCLWELNGNQLTYEELEVKAQMKEKENYINICIGFTPANNSIITGCEDGSIVGWGDSTIKYKYH